MNVSHEWLRGFVPHGLSANGIGELLGRHVATLDGLHRRQAALAPFVVARVVESENIPETKLSFNKVDDGSGTLRDVVCGAPNVTVGAMYPFARAGTTMPSGLVIEKRKIRGFTSNGMLCSARELGLGDEHDGILALDTTAVPGTPLLEVMPIGDVTIELDVLANRPDLLSQHGVAREASALTGITIEKPEELRDLSAIAAPVSGAREASSGGATVRLEDAAGCPRYTACVIRGVTVGPSPAWLVQRLDGVGARSINNVVDVTNYMLHGFGQPMHAFDLDTLAGRTIVVRRATAGETMTTLDGATRTLSSEMTVIADAEHGVAVGGVMGARDSEISGDTTDLLLEVAVFDPRRVRATRRALGLSTDASYRFERGVDSQALLSLLSLAAGLIVKIAGGRIDGAPLDIGVAPPGLSPVALRPSRAARLLGVALAREEILHRLESVGFNPSLGAAVALASDRDEILFDVPSWRHDVTREVDLIEEVARLRGFDGFPDELRPFRPGRVPDDPMYLLTKRVRERLVAAGFFEAKPMPFVKGDDETHVRVENPLAEDAPHLRASVLETLARRAEYNLNHGEGNLRLFEIGSVFSRSGAALPTESIAVGVLAMGARRPVDFTEPRPPKHDEWDAKAIAENIATEVFGAGQFMLHENSADALWTVAVGERKVGRVGRIALDAPVWASPAFGIEISLGETDQRIVARPGQNAWDHKADDERRAAAPVRFRPLPTMPPAEVDLALIVPDSVAAATIETLIRRTGGELLESVRLFDEFRGNDVPVGARSLAWRLTFRHPSRTLRDKEIDGRRSQLLKALEAELGVRPRTQ